MRIGVPKEIKNHEYRVGLTPDSVRELVHRGHEVWVQQNAGAAIGFSDDDYLSCGAMVVDTAAEVFDNAELIVKVKEPQPEEISLISAIVYLSASGAGPGTDPGADGNRCHRHRL